MITLQSVHLSSTTGRIALVDVSCAFRPGRTTALVGSPLSGKSLLLAALLGRVSPSGGTISVDDLDPATHFLEIRRCVSVMPTGAPLFGNLTVLEQTGYLVALRTGSRPLQRQAITALRMAEVPDRLMRTRTSYLTRFERILVWLAIQSMDGSSIQVLDDPARELGARETEELSRLVRERSSMGTTVLVATRAAEFGVSVADEVFHIENHQLKLAQRRTVE